jgi:predicted RNA-binding protein with PUA-like domain
MNHWLLKTEPASYSWADLVQSGRAAWDGVKNPAALGHLRAMQPGDQAFIYHTGKEKAVIGVARVVSPAYPDPQAADPRLVVVDLEPVRPLPTPVTLAAIKGDSRFAGFALVRISRLSVMPVDQAQWHRIVEMSRQS